MLTQEKLNNIHRLKSDEIFQILHECIEYLGIEDMETACKILGISKRRIYQLLNDNNSIQIGIHKFPCINILVK